MAGVAERREARAARWAAQVQVYRQSVTLYQAAMRRTAERRAASREMAARLRGPNGVAALLGPPPIADVATDATQRVELPADVTSSAKKPAAETPATAPRAIDEQGSAQLTRRQREVASLIARGLTNRQIADELVLCKGTVANHVEHILVRLDLRSRTQVAVWAVERGLATLPPS